MQKKRCILISSGDPALAQRCKEGLTAAGDRAVICPQDEAKLMQQAITRKADWIVLTQPFPDGCPDLPVPTAVLFAGYGQSQPAQLAEMIRSQLAEAAARKQV